METIKIRLAGKRRSDLECRAHFECKTHAIGSTEALDLYDIPIPEIAIEAPSLTTILEIH